MTFAKKADHNNKYQFIRWETSELFMKMIYLSPFLIFCYHKCYYRHEYSISYLLTIFRSPLFEAVRKYLVLINYCIIFVPMRYVYDNIK